MIILLATLSCGKEITGHGRQMVMESSPEMEQLSLEDNMMKAVLSHDLVTIGNLAKRGVSVNLELSSGQTLLTYSLERNHTLMIETLLKYGAQANRIDKRGVHPLYLAIETKSTSIVRALLQHGARANDQDDKHTSALIHAIQLNQPEIAYLLLDHNADAMIADRSGRNAFDYAQEYGLETLALSLYLRSNLMLEMNNFELLLRLFEQGDVSNIKEMIGNTPHILHRFTNPGPISVAMKIKCEKRALETTEFLLSMGESPNGRFAEDMAPLSLAASLGRLELMKLLIERKAELRHLNAQGESALIHAIKSYQPQAVKLLLEHKAEKKYSFHLAGESRKIDACQIARNIKSQTQDAELKRKSDDILWELNCGLRWLFSL
jgi:uncharacterized protein